MTSSFRRLVRPFAVVPAALASLLLAACSGGDDVASSSAAPATTAAPAPTAPASAAPSPAPATVPATAPVTIPPPPEPAALLQAALDQYAGGYHFATTITTNGAVATTAEGDRIGDGTSVLVTTAGTSLQYIVLPDASWVGTADGWQQLDEVPTTGDLVSSLRQPASLAVTGWDGTTAAIDAVYPASALALGGEEPITISLTIVGGALQMVAYTAPGNPPSTVTAVVSPLTTTTPITAPSE